MTEEQERPLCFIIRRSDVGEDEFPDFPMLGASRYAEVLRPISFPSKPIKGWGNHRIEVLGCEISFSEEMVGFQVDFDGRKISEPDAQQIAKEIAANITRTTGHPAEVVQI